MPSPSAMISRAPAKIGRSRTTTVGRTERDRSTLRIRGISHPMALPLPFPLPFSKLRIRGISHPIALPLPYPLTFLVLRIISVAFPLPFQHLFPLPYLITPNWSRTTPDTVQADFHGA